MSLFTSESMRHIVEEVYGPVVRAEVKRVLDEEIERAERVLRDRLKALAAGTAINITTWRDQFKTKGVEFSVVLHLPEEKSDGTV